VWLVVVSVVIGLSLYTSWGYLPREGNIPLAGI
jgi:hypothetical protein